MERVNHADEHNNFKSDTSIFKYLGVILMEVNCLVQGVVIGEKVIIKDSLYVVEDVIIDPQKIETTYILDYMEKKS